MRLIRGFHNLVDLPVAQRGCALTIGNFDGVHRGHQAVLAQLQARAAELQVPATVMVFEPTPQEFFSPETAPARLQRLRDKLVLFKQLGVERVICLRFNRKLAERDASAFVQDILVDGLDVRHLVIGDDFCFGKDRSGDFAFLQQAGQQHGFEVVSTQTVAERDERVSSTRIREALSAGELAMAEQLLGRPYTMCGRVAPGQQRGRTIGFPTANVRLHRAVSPVSGVFAVRVHGLGDEQPLTGVANLGTRPTVCGKETVLETHLFDFDRDIYGQYVEIEFCKKLREEKKFESFEALKQQIQQDAEQARQFFSE
ncbi:FMN adenylyltransferase / Riboflavin kinase [hydrothermal vent metagenome]|uniref:Bifunctional riboflavin kinase/FMN adenylyltransferase n=1 Tax=hydrothermal vent metagenome TaxID=652676 RepID=A0A3B0YHC0_9ZZZZ